jgi:hypothetical protein
MNTKGDRLQAARRQVNFKLVRREWFGEIDARAGL